MTDFADRIAKLSLQKLQLLALDQQRRLAELEQARAGSEDASQAEPVAVVGLGCRLPGGVDSPEAFWELLRTGREALGEVQPERWPAAAWFDPDPHAPGRMSTRRGGFLEQIDRFDAAFFGISPREAASLDPQQRLLLEVAWETLEHAAMAPDRLAGSNTGVFIGMSSHDYAQALLNDDPAQLDAYAASGGSHAVAAGRLSYFLGLQGPSLALDTACSSSLMAVHLACQSLRAGECELALAGGVNVILDPTVSVVLSKAGMMAADGRCKFGAAGADGFVRAEGCVLLALKPLARARRDGDRIFALLRASAANQDGRSAGLTAPNGPAQQALLRAALARSGLAPRDIGYVEAHGTGTALGDPIELGALGAILGAGRPHGGELVVGSLKTNLGHLEAAAGAAGLLKLILALEHGVIPPSLHGAARPSALVDWAGLGLRLAAAAEPWPLPGRRCGGVSAFGFAGTNVHVVAEQGDERAEPAAAAGPELLVLSARSQAALGELARRWGGRLEQAGGPGLSAACRTGALGRAHFAHRLALVAGTADEAARKLKAFAAGEAAEGISTGRAEGPTPPEVAFLFTGQGSQHPGMGRQLYQTEPIFREALDRCAELLRPQLDRPLLEVIDPGTGAAGEAALIHETCYTQPALFALEYALAELWRSWGVRPAAVLGHSVGEYAAACVAEALSLEDGLRLIAERGRLMQALPRDGMMTMVLADEARVRGALKSEERAVSIAALNGPAQTVISGECGAVRRVMACLEAQGIASQPLQVSHAFHSPLMEPMLDEFEAFAERLAYAPPRLDLIGNVTGAPWRRDEAPTAAYWRRHVRQPVRFIEGMRALHGAGYRIFLELGPSPTLINLGRRGLAGTDNLWLASLRPGRADRRQLLESLGSLFVAGVPIDWPAVLHGKGARAVMPTYPFQRERHWANAVRPRRPGDWQSTTAAATPATPPPLERNGEEAEALPAWLYEVRWSERPLRAPGGENGGLDFLAAPGDVAARVQPRLASLCAAQQLEVYNELLPELDHLCVGYIARGLRQLGWTAAPGETFTSEELASRLGVTERQRRLFARLLEILGEESILERGGDARWRVRQAPPSSDPRARLPLLLARFPACTAELTTLGQCAAHLAEVLRGTCDPLQLLFPGGSLEGAERLYRETPSARVFNTLLQESVSTALERLPQGRTIRILELGAGTGGTTAHLLPHLPRESVDFLFTDVSPLFIARAREQFAPWPFVQFGTLDISQDPARQGHRPASFDLVIAANVLHATADLRRSLRHARDLLAPGGMLVLLECVRPQRFGDLTVGLTDGWWAFSDRELRPDYALLPPERWTALLGELGFGGVTQLPGETAGQAALAQQRVILARAQTATEPALPGERRHTGNGHLRRARRWLIFANPGGGVGSELAMRLRERGEACGVVHPGAAFAEDGTGESWMIDQKRPEDYLKLTRAAVARGSGEPLGVIYLWGLDAMPLDAERGQALLEDQDLVLGGALRLAQALTREGGDAALRLWLVTRGAHSPCPAEFMDASDMQPPQATLWGLAKVIALEHPELNCINIDLDPHPETDAVGALLAELEAAMDGPPHRLPQERVVAWRRGVRFTPRLVRAGEASPATPTHHLKMREDAAYLITGGLGGLGLATARWLASRGARRLALAGRSAPGGDARALIEELEAQGVHVLTLEADVAQAGAVERLVAQVEAELGPLAGVVHAAGVLSDGALLSQSWERFERVLAPKVLGAWALHRATRHRALDFFVLYSSGASLLGSPGQANHAAANAFLDALAHWRRGRGLAALSINWGPWAEVGAAAGLNLSPAAEAITPRQGVGFLERLLASGATQAGVLPVRWADYLEPLLAEEIPPFLEELARETVTAPASRPTAGCETDLVRALAQAPAVQRWALLHQFVTAQAGRVLGLKPSQGIDDREPLNALGLDSLMAVELRNRLGQGVRRTLPATLIFERPTVRELVRYLGEEVLALEAKEADEAAKAPAQPSATELDDLSTSELAALLTEKLDALERNARS